MHSLRWVLAVPLAAFACEASVAGADDDRPQLVLSPESQWVLDYADENCGLRRLFGNNQIQVLLELSATMPGHTYRLILISDQLKVRRNNLHIGYEPGAEQVKHENASIITMEDGRRGFLSEMTVFAPGELEAAAAAFMNGKSYHDSLLEKVEVREREISHLRISKGFHRDFSLELDQFRQAMAAMRACQDDLVKSWGFDPDALRTLSRPPVPKHQTTWARELQRAYPSRMVMQGWGATIRIRLTVGPDGRPSECHVRADGQQDDFTKTSCEILMKEARFEPALDLNGDPTSALWTTRIIYRLR